VAFIESHELFETSLCHYLEKYSTHRLLSATAAAVMCKLLLFRYIQKRSEGLLKVVLRSRLLAQAIVRKYVAISR